MEEKVRELELLEKEISRLEGAALEISISPDSELHEEIREMKKERKRLKGSIIF